MMFAYSLFANFSITDGLVFSAFSISVVFVVLLILQFLIVMFSKIISSSNNKMVSETVDTAVINTATADDSEEQLVAKIVSACFVQEGSGKNVVIKSIKRVK